MLREKIAMYYMYYGIKNNPLSSRKKIEYLQLLKLKKLIRYAYRNVAYYRDLMDKHNISFNDINALDDLKKIPVSTKNDLRQHKVVDLISKESNISELHRQYTSGTSSEPFEIYFTKREGLMRSIILQRCFFIPGYKAYHKILRIGPSYGYNSNWLNRVGLFRKISLNSFTPINDQISLAKKLKPDILVGYPSCLKLLALEVKKRNIDFIKPKMIFTFSEFLYDEDRRFIESTFNSIIFNIYGAWEFGIVAFECKNHSGLHINEDFFIVDLLDTKEKNEKEIIITSLLAHKMPFIRYKLGDLVVIDNDDCSCGIKFRKIIKITGRLTNYFILPNDQKISENNVHALFKDNTDYLIKQFKIIQHSKKLTEIVYVRDKELTEGEEIRINNAFEKNIGKITLKLTKKDRIPLDKSGKFLNFESRV